ncbi:MAG: T9SS type A sorting domain-containing protein [Ignavibacteria bacterium]
MNIFYLNENVQIGIPSKFELSQNYPNPFNPSTNLEFGISELGFVSLKVYDASGKEVVTLINEIKPAGYYSVKFNGAELSRFIYILSSTGGSGNFISTKRMILLK